MGRAIKYYLLRFLRLRGTAGKIALGFAVGACVNFFPTFGLAIPVAAGLAVLCRGDATAGVIGDLLFKPLWPLFFYLNLVTGKVILKRQLWTRGGEWPAVLHHGKMLQFLGKSFILGAVANSLLMGPLFFFLGYETYKRFRQPLIMRLRRWKPRRVGW